MKGVNADLARFVDDHVLGGGYVGPGEEIAGRVFEGVSLRAGRDVIDDLPGDERVAFLIIPLAFHVVSGHALPHPTTCPAIVQTLREPPSMSPTSRRPAPGVKQWLPAPRGGRGNHVGIEQLILEAGDHLQLWRVRFLAWVPRYLDPARLKRRAQFP